MLRIAKNIFDLVGNTPLVRINNLNPNKKVIIFAKLEKFNPSCSVKDRIVKYLLWKAEKERKIKKGDTIIEATSGNTGIALAMMANLKGYKAKIIMPTSMSLERKKLLKMLGAEIIYVKDENEAIYLAKEISQKKGYFYLNQFENEENSLAHYETTAREILEQTKGKIEMFLAGMGTGGTITGVGKRLKEFNQKIKIVGVEPALKDEDKIQGLKNFRESSYKPPIIDEKFVDEIILVREKEAMNTTKQLIKKEGLLVGISSGAVMWATIQKVKKIKKKMKIVILFADGLEKYFSTKLFD